MPGVFKTYNYIFQMPDVFAICDAIGYYQTEIVRKMISEKELADWHHYRNTPTRNLNTRMGAANDLVGLPGPPMTPVERRLAGSPPRWIRTDVEYAGILIHI